MLRESAPTHPLDPPNHPSHPLRRADGAGQEGGLLGMDLRYRVKSPQQVLVRLRVDHLGFPTIHQQRFGAQFVGLIANPDTVLTFTKKKKETPKLIKQPGEKSRGKSSSTRNGQGQEDASGGGRVAAPFLTLTLALPLSQPYLLLSVHVPT